MWFFLAKENPHSTLEALHNSPDITMWTGANATYKNGPYLCEWPVNGTKYLSMLGSWLITELAFLNVFPKLRIVLQLPRHHVTT
jgi:hypothetical protein